MHITCSKKSCDHLGGQSGLSVIILMCVRLPPVMSAKDTFFFSFVGEIAPSGTCKIR